MTPLQRTIDERARILAKELEAAAVSAPNGQVIDRCETLLLADGREFLRRALEATLRDLSTLQIAGELDIHRSDVQAMVQSLRQGVVDCRPAAALEGEVECDEVYVVAGHKGSPGVVEATGGSGVGGA